MTSHSLRSNSRVTLIITPTKSGEAYHRPGLGEWDFKGPFVIKSLDGPSELERLKGTEVTLSYNCLPIEVSSCQDNHPTHDLILEWAQDGSHNDRNGVLISKTDSNIDHVKLKIGPGSDAFLNGRTLKESDPQTWHWSRHQVVDKQSKLEGADSSNAHSLFPDTKAYRKITGDYYVVQPCATSLQVDQDADISFIGLAADPDPTPGHLNPTHGPDYKLSGTMTFIRKYLSKASDSKNEKGPD